MVIESDLKSCDLHSYPGQRLSRLAASNAWAVEKTAVDYINPMVGASTSAEYGEGKTFPGAATPFGLVQLSPDTITGGDNGPGYSYEHKTIEGFSFTHMSGIGWYGDLGNFQVMPVTGPLQTDRDQAKSEFRHEEETAQAGYYGVKLRRYGILAEMTAAPRAGILRFTYPESKASRIQIDLHRRIGETNRWKQHQQAACARGRRRIRSKVGCTARTKTAVGEGVPAMSPTRSTSTPSSASR